MIIYQKVKMLVYTNKKSGKNFICIREVQDDEGLFITPPNEKGDPRIISLKFDLFFDDTKVFSLDDPLAINFLHEKQITMFKQDITRNFYRVASNIIQIYNSYTSDQLEKVKLEGGDWAELMDAAEKLINSGIADKLELIRD